MASDVLKEVGMTALFAIFTLGIFVVALMAWVELRAPQGYEDDSGFHLGEEPRSTR